MLGEYDVIKAFLHWSTIDWLSTVMPLLILLVFMTLALRLDHHIGRVQKQRLFGIIIAAFCLILENILEGMLMAFEAPVWLRTVNAIIGYSLRPVFLVLFLGMICPERQFRVEWGLLGLNAAVYLTALFTPLPFYYDEMQDWHPGPLRNTCLVISAILLAELLYHTIRMIRKGRNSEMLLPVFCILLIAVSVLLDYNTGGKIKLVTFLTIAIVFSLPFYYIWLHLQFVREHENDLEAQQRIRLMTSQIEPHFLYNTLSTVQALCDTDPQAAKSVIEHFGTYLQRNLDSLTQTETIPLEKELEHTKSYAEIEMTRFENLIVEYDIRDTDVMLPALTLQPLVENAVRHGVRGCEQGLVTVTARCEGRYHEIEVRDNGIGFDTGTLVQMNSDHIGLKNVRERIEKMCGGTLTIKSGIGEGTVVTIRIPDQNDGKAGRRIHENTVRR